MENCWACGFGLRPDARFCGQCGVDVASEDARLETAPNVGEEEAADQASDGTSSEPLEKGHGEAGTGQANESDPGRTLVAAATSYEKTSTWLKEALSATLAERPALPTVVFVGERGRGKTAWLNELLGGDVLPNGDRRETLVRVQYGEQSEIAAAGQQALQPATGSRELRVEVAYSPAPILARCDFVDTPPINNGNGEVDRAIRRAAYAADLIVVCLSTKQLLSTSEQSLIRDALVRATRCPLVFAVRHGEEVEAKEDRDALVQRIERFVAKTTRDQPIRVVGRLVSDADPVQELREVIEGVVDQPSVDRRRGEQREHLLNSVEALLPAVSDEPTSPKLEEQVREILRLEHQTALNEAASRLQVLLASVRRQLPASFANRNAAEIAAETTAALQAQIEQAAGEAAQTYVTSLQRALSHDRLTALRQTSRELNAGAAALASVQGPEVAHLANRPPDWFVVACGKAGKILLERTASWKLMLAGVGALAVANHLGKRSQKIFDQQARRAAAETADAWLDATQSQLLKDLIRESENIYGEVAARVLAAIPAAAPDLSPAEKLRTALTAYRRAAIPEHRAHVSESSTVDTDD